MSLQVSKAARQEKRFQDYNERCTFHHQARVSGEARVVLVRSGLGQMAREGPKVPFGGVLSRLHEAGLLVLAPIHLPLHRSLL